MKIIEIVTPLTDTITKGLTAGDQVRLSGIVYTARDAAHKRLTDLINKGERLPVELRDQAIYYTGPAPAHPGTVIGSAGPTTSSRMDAYAPALIEKTGLRAMIGKGNRNQAVIAAMKQYGCVYFAAIGGAGALISRCIRKAEVVCYQDLGPEAIHRLEVEELSLTVAIDCKGNNLYATEPLKYRRTGL